ncbi:MAG: methyltransferase domain-containing protein [Armatimonadetes bacterium]|nr:methyltransferase domain-containing protein [Armatimonadota bacterium]
MREMDEQADGEAWMAGVPLREEKLFLPDGPLCLLACPDLELLLVDEAALERPPYWAVVWPAGRALAEWLAAGPCLAGRRVLELGCGTGVAGLAAARRGAGVVQTDLFPEACALAHWNARRNRVCGIHWVAADWRAWPLSARFDLVLGADIAYESAVVPALERVLAASVAPDGMVWIADTGRPPALALGARLESAGWRVDLRELPRPTGPAVFLYEARPPA